MDIRTAAQLLGGEVSGRAIRCPGPGHSAKDRSMVVRFVDVGDGLRVTSFAGDDWRDCKDYVRERLGLSRDWARPDPIHVDDTPRIDVEKLRKQRDALSMWARSKPVAGTLAETYLASRGLTYDGDALRFYPGGRAMIALITDIVTADPCGVHCTYLDRDGKKTGRKMHGRAGGGVVRLSSDDEVTTGLAIAEGIETALAVPARPVWATLSANTLERFPVLDGIEALTVFADNDASGTGQRAANACARRWHEAERETTINIINQVGADFADLISEAA